MLFSSLVRAVASMRARQRRQMPPLDLILGDTIRASGFASTARAHALPHSVFSL